jgi:4-alpha-glucanotransferase
LSGTSQHRNGRRRSGILLHPTSLPGPRSQGDLGADARRFVEFLAAAGQTVWQMLPLGPTHDNLSPYQCLSLNAGNPRLISFQWLSERGWLEAGAAGKTDPAQPRQIYARNGQLAAAWRCFRERADESARVACQDFMDTAAEWLDDYALFIALRREFDHADWTLWPAPLRDRDEAVLADARKRHRTVIDLVRFEQFLFHYQWSDLKDYANRHEILLFGDMPIFVAHDSVDVWVDRRLFDLDSEGRPRVVAGVPPDYFSDTGQRWGNPHYRWDILEQEGFSWWIRRIERQLAMFDLVRIDHFRGFEAFWEIPADHADARGGRWVEGPGQKLFDALRNRLGDLPLVAEDLGVITPEVNALRDRYGLPGMRILQFAFDGSVDNPYLPHNHRRDAVVYTGTHDNDTTLGWYQGLDQGQRDYMLEYLGQSGEPMPWPLIRAATASVADMAVVPLQDALGLDSAHRMNTPGTSEGNWGWRFSWDQVPEGLAARLRRMARIYGR